MQADMTGTLCWHCAVEVNEELQLTNKLRSSHLLLPLHPQKTANSLAFFLAFGTIWNFLELFNKFMEVVPVVRLPLLNGGKQPKYLLNPSVQVTTGAWLHYFITVKEQNSSHLNLIPPFLDQPAEGNQTNSVKERHACRQNPSAFPRITQNRQQVHSLPSYTHEILHWHSRSLMFCCFYSASHLGEDLKNIYDVSQYFICLVLQLNLTICMDQFQRKQQNGEVKLP